MIRILVVDDQKLVRQGIKVLLEGEPDIEVIDLAADGQEAVLLIASAPPDVVLMDIRMPQMDGVTATKEITTRFPNVAVIILTTFDDDEYIFEGVRAGARGYLLKDIDSDEMAAAIRTVAAGNALIQPSITRKVLTEFRRLSTEPSRIPKQSLLYSLTDRELDVLHSLADGLSNQEIADQLVITEGTVKNHVSNLLGKLEVRDRTQAVLKGQELRLI